MAAIAPQLIGESADFHALLDRVSDLAALNRPILITGERGTGKELIASRLHFLSARWEQAYVSVNCAAFTEEGLEIELFGDGHTDGRLASADGGTLFLDNIEALPLWMQEKLQRAIEHGEYEAPESQITHSVDIRYLAALSGGADARALIKNGQLSSEFMDRVATHMLILPPLRSRPDDIAPLVTFFGRKIVSNLGAERFPGITPEALAFLQGQPWPGNIRELKNLIERSVAEAFLRDETLSEPIHDMVPSLLGAVEEEIQTPAAEPLIVPQDHTAPAPQPAMVTTDFNQRVMVFERQLIDQAMDRHDHHQGKAADYLGLTYHQFRGLLRKHGLKK